jgi:hypothetical protein
MGWPSKVASLPLATPACNPSTKFATFFLRSNRCEAGRPTHGGPDRAFTESNGMTIRDEKWGSQAGAPCAWMPVARHIPPNHSVHSCRYKKQEHETGIESRSMKPVLNVSGYSPRLRLVPR